MSELNYYDVLLGIDLYQSRGQLSEVTANKYRLKIISDINSSNDKIDKQRLNKYLSENGFKVINENGSYEIIHEEDVFTWRETGSLKVSIRIDGDGRSDRNFDKMPYFKIYSGKNFMSAVNITRISMVEPKYIIHNNQRWDLSAGQLKDLNTFISKKNKDGLRNWDIMCNAARTVAKNANNINSVLPINPPIYYKGMPEE